MRRGISIGVGLIMLVATIGGVLVLLGVASITSSSAAPTTQNPATGIYLALGDSLAAGVGATSPTEGGYVSQLFTTLQANGDGITELANFAISGETTTSLINNGQLDRAVAEIEDPASDVRVVSLSIGGNDLLGLLFGGPCTTAPAGPDCQQQVGTSLEGFAQNYPIILQRVSAALAAKGTGGRLYVHTYYNPFSGTGAVFEAPVDAALLGNDGVIDCAAGASDPGAMGLNDLIACTGASFDAQVVDVQPRFAQRGLLLTLIASRDIHPNDLGHTAIADALAEAVAAAH